MVKPKLPSTSSAAYRSSPDAVQLARQPTVQGVMLITYNRNHSYRRHAKTPQWFLQKTDAPVVAPSNVPKKIE